MKKWLLGIGITALIAVSVPVAQRVLTETTIKPQAPVAASEAVKPPTVDELLTLVNAEREKAGVKPLMLDQRLNQTAQMKSDDMQTSNYYGHVNPTTGKHGYQIIYDASIKCTYASENIVHNFEGNSSAGAIASWMYSPPHRAAILDKRYETTGFGVTSKYITEHFCDLN